MVYALNVVSLGDISIPLVREGMCTIVRTVIILKLNMGQIRSGDMKRIKYMRERRAKHKGGYDAMRKETKRILKRLGIY